MGTPLLLLFWVFVFCFISFPCFSTSAPPIQYSIYPNFTASYLQYLDNKGTFLFSPNRVFQASLWSSKSEGTSFHFSVVHVSTNSIVWTANRFKPISGSDKLYLTSTGITITDESRSLIWSTPQLDSEVSMLQLQNSGNLVLLDRNNKSLWQSFDYPTDRIVIGQQLAVGKWLEGSVAENNWSSGDYRFLVTDDDAVLQWKGMTYWTLSMNTMASKNANLKVSFLSINSSGLHFFASDGTSVVYNVRLDQADFRLAKMEYNGRFTVSSLVNDQWKFEEFTSTDDICQIPLSCGRLGLCSNGSCFCPLGFGNNLLSADSFCVPMNDSLSLSSSCDGTGTDSGLNSIRYMKLENGIDSFSNNFSKPAEYGANLSVCQELCSRNCSCIGLFHDNSSGSCYLMDNQTVSLMLSNADQEDRSGYIKVIASANVMPAKTNERKKKLIRFALASSPVFFLLIIFVVIGFICLRQNKISKKTTRVCSRNSFSEELDIVSIPGLPVKFDYEELVNATDNFKAEIGSGGFGTVYKGILPDSTIVAVKKINNSGINGKREFCGEIATIGSIRHVNLVRLKGFSIFGRKRVLVYEYMNKGSLDHALFGPGTVLTWQERFQIAIGVARGLDYLHNCCAHKIIHCDIKPENILLHDNLQVKISDFGLSKLLSTEQSNRITTLRGTRGYLAPEWLTSSRISDKSDVYSYGMVLLELVTGKRNCSLATQNPEERSTSMITDKNSSVASSAGSEYRYIFVPPIALQLYEQSRYMELVDPKLQVDVIRQEVEMLVKVALCCLHQEPTLRPTMANVVSMLQGETKLVEPRVEYLNFLRSYGGKFIEQSMPQLSSVT